MKTLIIGILCGVLIALPLQAQTTNAPAKPTEPELSLCIAVFLLTITVVSAVVILSVSCKHSYCPEQGSLVNVVLQKSSDNINWSNVVTNLVVYDTNAPAFELFRERIDREPSFYRVRFQAP